MRFPYYVSVSHGEELSDPRDYWGCSDGIDMAVKDYVTRLGEGEHTLYVHDIESPGVAEIVAVRRVTVPGNEP